MPVSTVKVKAIFMYELHGKQWFYQEFDIRSFLVYPAKEDGYILPML